LFWSAKFDRHRGMVDIEQASPFKLTETAAQCSRS
jgi:hypothetical protein